MIWECCNNCKWCRHIQNPLRYRGGNKDKSYHICQLLEDRGAKVIEVKPYRMGGSKKCKCYQYFKLKKWYKEEYLPKFEYPVPKVPEPPTSGSNIQSAKKTAEVECPYVILNKEEPPTYIRTNNGSVYNPEMFNQPLVANIPSEDRVKFIEEHMKHTEWVSDTGRSTTDGKYNSTTSYYTQDES